MAAAVQKPERIEIVALLENLLVLFLGASVASVARVPVCPPPPPQSPVGATGGGQGGALRVQLALELLSGLLRVTAGYSAGIINMSCS